MTRSASGWASQFDSLNWIPPVPKSVHVEHVPKFKLLVSPVVPPLARQDGAAADPSDSPRVTSIEEPLLKTASEPPASPRTLNSALSQTEEISSTLSLPVTP